MRIISLFIISILLVSCQDIPSISEDISDLETMRGNKAISYNQLTSDLQLSFETQIADPVILPRIK